MNPGTDSVAKLLVREESSLPKEQVWVKGHSYHYRVRVEEGGRIRMLGSGEMPPEAALEIGQYLVGLAEQQQEFDRPAPLAKIRLGGKGWRSRFRADHFQGEGFLVIWPRVIDGLGYKEAVVVDWNAVVTSRIARESGAYLADLARQQIARRT